MRTSVALFLGLFYFPFPLLAEDHLDPAPPPNNRPDGDADRRLKEKAADLFAEIFAPIPKTVILADYNARVPEALTAAKNGDGATLSGLLTPLFGTLDTTAFQKLTDALDRRIRAESDSRGTVDNRFLDLLEQVGEYARDGVRGEVTSRTEKEKAVGDRYRTYFLAQQRKNRELNAKATRINQLKRANQPENAAEIERLQNEIGAAVNPRALLSFLETRGAVGESLRDALARKADSGHQYLEVTQNGQPARLHLGADGATADRALAAYRDQGLVFSPRGSASPRDLFIDAVGHPVAGTPTGFRLAPAPPAKPPAPPAGNPPPTGGADSGALARLKEIVNCNSCHGAVTVTGSSLSDVKIVGPRGPVGISELVAANRKYSMKIPPGAIAELQAMIR